MLQLLGILVLFCFATVVKGQQTAVKKPAKNAYMDSSLMREKESTTDDLPVVGLNENERVSPLPSILTANRDMFTNMAGFHFSTMRFRIRGYDGENSSRQINGLPMNSPEDGTTQWGLWSGLNAVMNNTETSLGLYNSASVFGSIGQTTQIDLRASRQRQQTQFAYTFSNRSFAHRLSFIHSSGMHKKGWAFSVSGSLRYASEGYTPGTFYNGKSYCISADKKIDDRNLLSIAVFGAPLYTGKQSAVLMESVQLAQTNRYNAYWGYQAGKKRNANTHYANQPVLLIRHDRQIDNHTGWTTAIGIVTGQRSDTGLDWYKAADPRPDYYRYLPGYQQDPLLKMAVTEAIKTNSGLLQVNWDHLIDVNRNSQETIRDADGRTGNNIRGLRAHYIVEERISALSEYMFNSNYHSLLTDALALSAGFSMQAAQSHNYKKLNDLLGGDFYVDWNQFAERDFPNDPVVIQNDTHRPNRLLHKDDSFGYDYLLHTLVAKTWAQLSFTGKKIDHFEAVEIGYTNYQREGLVTNGLFTDNSFGRSVLDEFTCFAFKTGITYKINGRKYLYLQAGYFTRAPLFDNVFISPRTRDTQQENIRNEKILTTELGYTWNAPLVKLRLRSYVTLFSDGMNVTSFYDDGFGNFVNYALSGINKMHFGLESGADIQLSEHFSLNLAIAAARYYYTNRQQVTVTADNDASVIERGLIYTKNFRVGGTPQEAYGLGIQYQAGGFYVGLTGSYFRQQWLDFNPLRRTYTALQGLTPGTDQWKQVVAQSELPAQYTVDLSAGSAIRLKLFHAKNKKMFLFNAGISNLLNNRTLISGGYEQLRFDTDTKNTDKFPPKFFYAMGLNFSVTLSLRL